MWGSPAELEAAALHFTHVHALAVNSKAAFAATSATWASLGGPFAADDEAHAAMRRQMWGDDEALSRGQVVSGFAVVWASMERNVEREAVVAPWLERVLDEPQLAGTPDVLNMVLFALMGFVSSDVPKFVQRLSVERDRVGGHELRGLHIVAERGPTKAGLTYTRPFNSWDSVVAGVQKALAALESARVD